jgi:hypothetical protein
VEQHSLAQVLEHLLKGHGVAAERAGHQVSLPGGGTASLRMYRPESVWMMEFRAEVDGVVLEDRWAAMGAEIDAAYRDGLDSFCRCGFHVLLAALWGVLERDQVEHVLHLGELDGWDLYLGPAVQRAANAPALQPPVELYERVMTSLHAALEPGQAHLLRVYVATLNGEVVVEVLLDDEEHPELWKAVAESDWQLPATGFASLRWVVVARRRRGGPTHRVERTCGEGGGST